MDAKAKANFIKSVVGAQKILCPKCNSLNDSDAIFCEICGKKIKADRVEKERPSDGMQGSEHRIRDTTARPAFQMAVPQTVDEPEEAAAFAKGLPDWDVLPPQILVRRNK